MRFLRMTCGNAALRAGGAASSVFVGVWVCVRAHGRVHKIKANSKSAGKVVGSL
jgi:hypothetical protein